MVLSFLLSRFLFVSYMFGYWVCFANWKDFVLLFHQRVFVKRSPIKLISSQCLYYSLEWNSISRQSSLRISTRSDGYLCYKTYESR